MKRNDVKITIIGFTIIYLVCMVFSTYLSKCSIEKDYEEQMEQVSSNITQEFYENRQDIFYYNEDNKEYLYCYMNYVLSHQIDSSGEGLAYQQLSAALYDCGTGEKVAQSTNVIGKNIFQNRNNIYYVFALDEYFEKEEIRQFADAFVEEKQERATEDRTLYEEHPQSYKTVLEVYHDTMDVKRIALDVFEIVVSHRQGDLFAADEVERKNVLEWSSSENTNTVKSYEKIEMSVVEDFGLYFPYMADEFKVESSNDITYEYDYKAWERWQNDEYLQNYPESIDAISDVNYSYQFTLPFPMMGEDEYLLCIRQTTHPWLAAMDYMKFVYIGGFLFMFICIAVIIHSSNKYYKHRTALENTRRDFTNAIAHELKTPLGIIRGFAENSLENTNKAKREYYLQQIIGQTEEMDELVKQMIYVSKLDSEEIQLKKEALSFKKIVDEQLSRLEPLVEEKNLDIRVEVRNDFQVEGDKQYLERAIWNVLENAIEYNRQEGFVKVLIDKNECRIENTGNMIAEEDLAHIFDMFYTGDKSRKTSHKHMGLGLYLTKKILELHKLNIKVQNTEIGVEVIVYT